MHVVNALEAPRKKRDKPTQLIEQELRLRKAIENSCLGEADDAQRRIDKHGHFASKKEVSFRGAVHELIPICGGVGGMDKNGDIELRREFVGRPKLGIVQIEPVVTCAHVNDLESQ